MNYSELKQKHSVEINEFPMFFAFSNDQFEKGLAKFNCVRADLTSISVGGFIKSVDAKKYVAMLKRFTDEDAAAMLNDDFLIGAFKYELANHEFGYTGDPTSTLEALDITLDDDRKVECFNAAKAQYMAENQDNF
jgi:hypothetical protein